MNDDGSINELEDMKLRDVYKIAYNLLNELDKNSIKESLEDRIEVTSEQNMINAYIDKNKKQLGNICNVLGFTFKDLDVLKEGHEKGAYGIIPPRIPIAIAPVLVAILRSGSKRGGYISKIVNKNFEKITPEEKECFIEILHEELIKAKTYSKSITDEHIESIINSLKYQVDLSDNLARYLETGMLQAIKRDVFNINKIDMLTSVGIPNLSWIKEHVTYYDKTIESLRGMKTRSSNCPHIDISECIHISCKNRKKCNVSDECANCDLNIMCNKCSEYNKCRSEYKTSKPFRGFDVHERDIFTEIYIGMLQNARETFIKFVKKYTDEFDDNENSFISNIPINDISNDEDIDMDMSEDVIKIIKQSVKKILFDDGYDRFVCSETLENLEAMGINADDTVNADSL